MPSEKSYYFVSHAGDNKTAIKPVIESLLDAGVPLWIDVPDAPALGLKRSRFAGFIQEGEPWDSQIRQAIAQACGLILFPSPAAADPKCGVKFEVWQAKSEYEEDVKQFKIFAVLMRGADGDALERIDVKNQGFVLAANGDWDNGFALTEHCQGKLALMAEMLNQHAAVTTRRNDSRGNEADLRDESLPFRVNRLKQRKTASKAYEDHFSAEDARAPTRPCLVVHGDTSEHPEQCGGVTMPTYLLRNEPHLPFTISAASQGAITVSWPDDLTLPSPSFDEVLTQRIAGLSGNVADPWSATPEILAAAFRSDGVTRLVQASWIPARDTGRPVLLAALRAWFSYWDRFPWELCDRGDKVMVVPILDIDLGDKKTSSWSWRKPKLRECAALLAVPSFGQQLANELGLRNVKPAITPRLGGVTNDCVRQWLQGDDPVFAPLSLRERDRLMRELQRAVLPDGCSMTDWYEAAAPILARAGY
jgi:hypothetical protein